MNGGLHAFQVQPLQREIKFYAVTDDQAGRIFISIDRVTAILGAECLCYAMRARCRRLPVVSTVYMLYATLTLSNLCIQLAVI